MSEDIDRELDYADGEDARDQLACAVMNERRGMRKTQEVVALMQFPHEPNAVLSWGPYKVFLSATMMHHLSVEISPEYPQEDWAFKDIIETMVRDMIRSCPPMTDEEETILRERYHQFGHGFWSSWMNEPRPEWVNLKGENNEPD